MGYTNSIHSFSQHLLGATPSAMHCRWSSEQHWHSPCHSGCRGWDPASVHVGMKGISLPSWEDNIWVRLNDKEEAAVEDLGEHSRWSEGQCKSLEPRTSLYLKHCGWGGEWIRWRKGWEQELCSFLQAMVRSLDFNLVAKGKHWRALNRMRVLTADMKKMVKFKNCFGGRENTTYRIGYWLWWKTGHINDSWLKLLIKQLSGWWASVTEKFSS